MRNLPWRVGKAAVLLSMSIALGIPATHAADWPMLRGNPQRTGISEETVTPPLSALWRFTGTFQRNNPAAPAIVGSTAYFAAGSTPSGGGILFAVDVKTGAQKWR